MRLAHLYLLLVLSVLPLAGCGGNSTANTLEGDDIQSYIENNPEAVARQKAARDKEE